MINNNLSELAQYGIAGVCIYFAGVASIYLGMGAKSLTSFVIFLGFLVFLISAFLVQSFVESTNDKEKSILVVEVNRLTNELATIRAHEKWEMPMEQNIPLDVCVANDDNCIKLGIDHGKVTALNWCNKHGYKSVKDYAFTNSIQKVDTWRSGGTHFNKCVGSCLYFTSISCERI
ncbi:hypothetical protein JHL17_16825 [Azospirillum sp. YIM B02556]|uniref:Transmembrane protein n=1 Tax=Azospirillum endophyticum TaxID=2800326 RepID=A0ABS1F6P3_9PROT|nr:hypothetical protein [Azospirillum endophyticum]MBK1839077.1 hypothetical protein [Azospirillum endophyticum]